MLDSEVSIKRTVDLVERRLEELNDDGPKVGDGTFTEAQIDAIVGTVQAANYLECGLQLPGDKRPAELKESIDFIKRQED